MNAKRLTRAGLALLSGQFAQGGRQLRRSDPADGYCCLGVMCEIYRLDTGKGQWLHDPPRFDVGNGHKAWTKLPEPVAEWYGFANQDPRFCVAGQTAAASEHNDGYKPMDLSTAVERKTFQQIGAALLRLAGWTETTIQTMLTHARVLMTSHGPDSKPVFSLEWKPGCLFTDSKIQTADALVRFCNTGLEESDHE